MIFSEKPVSTFRDHALAQASPHISHLRANTQMLPPCGTSGYCPGNSRFMRDCILAGSTPQPDCTAMYCLPLTENDTGTAATPEFVGASHNTLPVLAS